MSGLASTTVRGYGPNTTWRLYRAGPGTIKWIVARAKPLDTTPFGHLYLHMTMMVPASVAVTSFAIPLLFSLPSCLRLHDTTFSAKGVGAGTSSLYSSNTSPDSDTRNKYWTSMRTFHSICVHHRFRRRCTSRSSSQPSPYSSSPTCCLHPRSELRADRRSSKQVWASRSCYRPFSVRATEEDKVAPATLRLSWLP
jgi:hypothetical protein